MTANSQKEGLIEGNGGKRCTHQSAPTVHGLWEWPDMTWLWVLEWIRNVYVVRIHRLVLIAFKRVYRMVVLMKLIETPGFFFRRFGSKIYQTAAFLDKCSKLYNDIHQIQTWPACIRNLTYNRISSNKYFKISEKSNSLTQWIMDMIYWEFGQFPISQIFRLERQNMTQSLINSMINK